VNLAMDSLIFLEHSLDSFTLLIYPQMNAYFADVRNFGRLTHTAFGGIIKNIQKCFTLFTLYILLFKMHRAQFRLAGLDSHRF